MKTGRDAYLRMRRCDDGMYVIAVPERRRQISIGQGTAAFCNTKGENDYDLSRRFVHAFARELDLQRERNQRTGGT